jgi:hypothetical protein
MASFAIPHFDTNSVRTILYLHSAAMVVRGRTAMPTLSFNIANGNACAMPHSAFLAWRLGRRPVTGAPCSKTVSRE